MMKCGYCQEEIDNGFEQCPLCHKKICPNCGNPLGSDINSCPKCGEKTRAGRIQNIGCLLLIFGLVVVAIWILAVKC